VRRYEFSRYNFTSSRFVTQKEVVVWWQHIKNGSKVMHLK
jgi:hypothetical protein